MGYLYLVVSVMAGGVMTLACLRNVERGQGQARQRMVLLVGLWLIAPILLMGGGLILSGWQLAWRSLPREILIWWCLIGAFPAVLSVGGCTENRERQGERIPHVWIVAVCAAVLVVDLVVLCGVKTLFFSGERDTLHLWEGQVVVVRNQPILVDSHLTAFAYHGPLVRGNEVLWEYRTS